ncbi:peptidylprolyl isomerase [Candidatus Fermentibacterales bacterium]|nr:peptidylprolyl isomerase [Candidatus Fermentibacterales bacterium]
MITHSRRHSTQLPGANAPGGLLPAIVALAILLSHAASPAEADVLASVDSATLTWEQLVDLVGGAQNIQYLGIRSESEAEELLMSWVREELIVRAAETDGIESEPIVAEALEQARRQVLLEAYLALLVDDIEVSRLEVENYVADWEESFRTEVKLRHIVVSDRDLAVSIRARLLAGTDFAELAAEYSLCPSAGDGGDLGWLRRGDAALSFEEAAYRLQPEQYSDVVETSMGYHIVQLLDRRNLSPGPSASDIEMLAEAELLQSRQEMRLEQVLDQLSQQYEISIHPERLMDHL